MIDIEAHTNAARSCTVDGCGRPRVSYGLCGLHRQRRDKGQPLGPAGLLTDPDYRFSTSYEVAPDGCWIWQKWCDPRGYGRFTFNNETVLAHRWAYERFVAPIPQGMTIDHLCRTPGCVNTAHMEVVTRSENNRRRFAAQTHCKRGHEFTADNTYRYPDGRRECFTCRREYQREWNQRKRAAS